MMRRERGTSPGSLMVSQASGILTCMKAFFDTLDGPQVAQILDKFNTSHCGEQDGMMFLPQDSHGRARIAEDCVC